MQNEASTQMISKKRVWRTVITLSLTAIIISSVIFVAANDVYAFFAEEGEVTLSIGAPSPLSSTAKVLEHNGIVSEPYIFTLYVKKKGKQAILEGFTGNITLDRSMSYREIILAFADASEQ